MKLFQSIKMKILNFLPIYRVMDVNRRNNIAYGTVYVKSVNGQMLASEYKFAEIANNKEFLDGFSKKDIFTMAALNSKKF